VEIFTLNHKDGSALQTALDDIERRIRNIQTEEIIHPVHFALCLGYQISKIREFLGKSCPVCRFAFIKCIYDRIGCIAQFFKTDIIYFCNFSKNLLASACC